MLNLKAAAQAAASFFERRGKGVVVFDGDSLKICGEKGYYTFFPMGRVVSIAESEDELLSLKAFFREEGCYD